MDREKMVNEILAFVDAHKESQASRAVVMRILGVRDIVKISNVTLKELRNCMRQTKIEEIELCYDIIS